MTTETADTAEVVDVPEIPKALGLNKLMHARHALQAGKARSMGYHPSEIFRSCPVLQWFENQAWENLASDDPAVIQEAYAFLRKKLDTNERQFSSGVKAEFSYGHAIHTNTQYELGLLGVLWGKWECPHCHHVTPVECFMPRMIVDDVNGDPLYEGAFCVHCKSNHRALWPWHYVEPTVYSDEWNIIGHCDGIIIITREGVTHKYVLEIKSAHEAKFEGKWKPLPIHEHVEQASLYGFVLKIEHILFIYVDKNAPSRWKEIVTPVSDISVQDAQNYVKAIRWGDERTQPPLYARVCSSIREKRAKGCVACEKCFGKKPLESWWDEDGSESR
jgi:glutaredoxin